MPQRLFKNDFINFLWSQKVAGGHRPQRSAAVGVLTNRNMGEQNSIFKQLLRKYKEFSVVFINQNKPKYRNLNF